MQHDIIKINQNDTYTLQAEKIKGKWWLELIERATGLTWILVCKTKPIALATFKGMTLEDCRVTMDKIKVSPIKMYKANVM